LLLGRSGWQGRFEGLPTLAQEASGGDRHRLRRGRRRAEGHLQGRGREALPDVGGRKGRQAADVVRRQGDLRPGAQAGGVVSGLRAVTPSCSPIALIQLTLPGFRLTAAWRRGRIAVEVGASYIRLIRQFGLAGGCTVN